MIRTRRAMRRATVIAVPLALAGLLLVAPTPHRAEAATGVGAFVYIANAGDGDNEDGRIDILNGAGANIPGFGIDDTTFENSAHNQMAVGDVNGDGRDEVLIANDGSGDNEDGRIDVIDPTTGDPIPAVGVLDTTFDNNDHNQMAVGDVNGDGRDEILIANDGTGDNEDGRIDVLDATTGLPVPGLGVDDTTFDNNDHNQMAVGDINGDGRDEILIANDGTGDNEDGRIDVLDATTHGPVPGLGIDDTTFDNSDHNQMAVGDVNGDGRDEVLIANDGTGDNEDGRVDILDAMGGGNVPGAGIDDTTFDNDDHNRMVVGDVNGDGRDEILIANDGTGDNEDGRIDILDATGANVPGLGIDDTTYDNSDHNQIAVGTFGRGDIDADGIPDRIERFGIRRADGTIFTKLDGASPCRKTIAVEIDYMLDSSTGHGHQPASTAIDEVRVALNGAPVPKIADCPYPGAEHGPGIQLILLPMGTIAEKPVLNVPGDFLATKADPQNFAPELLPYVHYSLWVHDYGSGGVANGSSGRASGDLPEGDFIVSVGSFNMGSPTPRQQSGTFLHELGHTLGLGHGGGDEVNFKPNYLSVMNYQFQIIGLTPNTGATYINLSDQTLPTLDSLHLNEQVGIPGVGAKQTTWYNSFGNEDTAPAEGHVDWSGDDHDNNGFTDDDPDVAVAINGGFCVSPGPNAKRDTPFGGDDAPDGESVDSGANLICESKAAGDDIQEVKPGTDQRTLNGFNDWENLNLRLGLGAETAETEAGAGAVAPIELTSAQAAEIETAYDQATSPDRSVRLNAPRSGFNEAVLGIAMDDRNIYATHYYQAIAEPHASDRPGSLIVLDRNTLQLRKRIPVGFNPHSVAVNPVTGRIYVLNGVRPTNPNITDVNVIDRTSLSVVATVPLVTAQFATDVAVNSRTNRVYVSNGSQGRLHVINGATNTELAPILVGPRPLGMAIDESTNTIYFAMTNRVTQPNFAGVGSVTDDGVTQQVHPAVDFGEPLMQPQDVAVDPVHRRLYTANLGAGGSVIPSVSVLDLDTRTLLTTINIGKPARAITVNPYAHQVFVAGDSRVTLIGTDTLSVQRNIAADLPFAVATADGPGRQFYLGDLRSGELTRLSYSSVEMP